MDELEDHAWRMLTLVASSQVWQGRCQRLADLLAADHNALTQGELSCVLRTELPVVADALVHLAGLCCIDAGGG